MLTERSREIPFLLNHAIGARDLLDIGSAGSKYLAALSQVAHKVTAIDTREFEVPYGVHGFISDAASMPPEWTGRFDCISCISVLDHVGLDAYGNEADPEALGKVVSEIARVTATGGRLIVTAPVGRPQLTTHPNGGQRVFEVNEFSALFYKDWRDKELAVYIEEGGRYKYTHYTQIGIDYIEYLGNRAGAVACLVLVKL